MNCKDLSHNIPPVITIFKNSPLSSLPIFLADPVLHHSSKENIIQLLIIISFVNNKQFVLFLI